jgi:hypothetical protein
MIIKFLSYFRKDTSTLLALSAIALLLASPLVLSNLPLQPVQAQTTLSFRTPTPAMGYDRPTGQEVALTFDAHGTTSSSDPQRADITNGTIQLQADPNNNGKIYPGKINFGFIDNRTGVGFIRFDATVNNTDHSVQSECSTSENNDITVESEDGQSAWDFLGPIECSSSQGGGGDTTTQSSSSSSSPMTGTTTQSRDGDGDGIPDSSDRCANNSNPTCFKEGDTTTQQQSSPSLPGNQTR